MKENEREGEEKQDITTQVVTVVTNTSYRSLEVKIELLGSISSQRRKIERRER